MRRKGVYLRDEDESSLDSESDADLGNGLVVFLRHCEEFFVLEDCLSVLIPDSGDRFRWISEWRVGHNLLMFSFGDNFEFLIPGRRSPGRS